MLLNVLDYPDPQAAIAAAQDGDRVYFPGGYIHEAPAAGWVITKSLEVFGDGPGNLAEERGSILVPSSVPPLNTRDVIVLAPVGGIELPHVYIHDLAIMPRAAAPGTGRHGIRLIDTLPTDSHKLSELVIERVSIARLGGSGIRLDGTGINDSFIIAPRITDCTVVECGDIGISLKFALSTFVFGTALRTNGREGLRAERSSLLVCGCSFEQNRTTSTGEGELYTIRCQLRVDACRFTDFFNATPSRALVADDGITAAVISGCEFWLGTATASAIGIDIDVTPIDGFPPAVVILANRFRGILGSDVSTLSDGRIAGYMKEYRFDYALKIVGEAASRVFVDAEGSYVLR